MIVTMVTKDIKYCTPENLSFTGRIGTMVVPLPGLNDTKSNAHITVMDKMQTGNATKNQAPQLGAGRMFCKAMMFCGLAIGEAIPPILDAKAIPRMSALENLDSEGRFLNIG